MGVVFTKGEITAINKETLEIYLEDKNAIIVLFYNPKKLYKVEDIEVGFKINFLYDKKDKTIYRLDVIKK